MSAKAARPQARKVPYLSLSGIEYGVSYATYVPTEIFGSTVLYLGVSLL